MFKCFIYSLTIFGLIATVGNVNSKPTTVLKTLPDETIEQHFKKVGDAKFTFLFWDIYNSMLFTSSGKFKPISETNLNQLTDDVLFKIKYLRDISRDELIERTVEQWQELGMVNAQYNEFIPQLKTLWPDIKAGDSLSLLLSNNESIFYFNDEYVGRISHHSFGTMFLSIWLSPNTSQPALRLSLLGKSENNK